MAHRRRSTLICRHAPSVSLEIAKGVGPGLLVVLASPGAPQGSRVKPEPQTRPIRRMTTKSGPGTAVAMVEAVVAAAAVCSRPGTEKLIRY